MKSYFLTLLLTFILLPTAWGLPESVSINLPNGVVLREVVNTTVVPLTGNPETDHCTATLTLPKFQYANPETESLAMKRISRKWFRTGLRSVNDFLLATANTETCQSDFFSAYQIDLGYSFTSQLGNMVTMVYSHYTYSGGAHGWGGYDKTLLDFSTGKEIPGTLDTFLKQEKLAELLNRIEQKLYQTEGFDSSFGWVDWKKGVSSLADISNFYFTNKGITIFFNPYAIGPYAAGIIEAELSWAEIRDLKNNSDFSASLPN